jgi:nitroreductase
MVGPWLKALSSSALASKSVNFADIVRSRRMSRSFSDQTVDAAVITSCVDLASRAPSAGKSQGWHVLLLENESTQRYWDVALPAERREGFAFPLLLRAPVIVLSMCDPTAYLERYSEPDKKATGLGEGLDQWVAPYWTIDASFATMTFLLALEDVKLGALFFAHSNEEGLRKEFSIPDHIQILGTIAIGHEIEGEKRMGRSANRIRRSVESIIHQKNW